MDQDKEKETVKVDDVEKDIQKSIEEMKNRYDYPWPEKKYKEIESKKISPMTSVKNEHDKRDRREKIIISLLGVISCLLVIISSVLLINISPDNKNIPSQKQNQTVSAGSQMIHDIQFSVNGVERKSESLTVDMAVSNKSKNNFYVTVSGISIVDENGKTYFPNLYKGQIPENFFGEKILPGTDHSAKIVFDGVPATAKNLTLIVNNVSDVYHFTWDYMITMP